MYTCDIVSGYYDLQRMTFRSSRNISCGATVPRLIRLLRPSATMVYNVIGTLFHPNQSNISINHLGDGTKISQTGSQF